MLLPGALICLAILLSSGLGVYLRMRQIENVARHRETVPADFAEEVTLDDHRRAADYTIARTRFGIVETIFDAVLSVAWLALWLAPLYALVAGVTEPGLTRSVVFVIAFTLIGHFLELPFSYFNAFSLEEKFGFNRLTPKTFILDEAKNVCVAARAAGQLVVACICRLHGDHYRHDCDLSHRHRADVQ